VSALTTKYLSVSIALPGPMIASSSPPPSRRFAVGFVADAHALDGLAAGGRVLRQREELLLGQELRAGVACASSAANAVTAVIRNFMFPPC
jgi:hypothetical protein